MQIPATFEALVHEANALNLYTKLIDQLNKDLSLANIDLVFDEYTLPMRLKVALQNAICHLIQNKFADYLNLLYVIDVSEAKVKALDGNDILKLSEAVTFLILQREWQKVWFKDRYQ